MKLQIKKNFFLACVTQGKGEGWASPDELGRQATQSWCSKMEATLGCCGIDLFWWENGREGADDMYNLENNYDECQRQPALLCLHSPFLWTLIPWGSLLLLSSLYKIVLLVLCDHPGIWHRSRSQASLFTSLDPTDLSYLVIRLTWGFWLFSSIRSLKATTQVCIGRKLAHVFLIILNDPAGAQPLPPICLSTWPYFPPGFSLPDPSWRCLI